MKNIMLFLFLIFSFFCTLLSVDAQEIELQKVQNEIVSTLENWEIKSTNLIADNLDSEKNLYITASKKKNFSGCLLVFNSECDSTKFHFQHFFKIKLFKNIFNINVIILKLLQATPRAP